MNKEIKIEVPEGYEIDKEKSSFEKIVFKKKDSFPTKWEDLDKIEGYKIGYQGDIGGPYILSTVVPFNKNAFPTLEEARASIALAQLCQLRDKYNEGWKPNWLAHTQTKYVVYMSGHSIKNSEVMSSTRVLAFKSPSIRMEFIKNFENLIKKQLLCYKLNYYQTKDYEKTTIYRFI